MSSDEELAALIVDRLIEQDLIDVARKDDIASLIAAGSVTAEDWRLWIELGPAVRTDGGGDAKD